MVFAENKYQELNNEVDQTISNDKHLPINCFVDPDCTVPIPIASCCLWPLLHYYRHPKTGHCCFW